MASHAMAWTRVAPTATAVARATVRLMVCVCAIMATVAQYANVWPSARTTATVTACVVMCLAQIRQKTAASATRATWARSANTRAVMSHARVLVARATWQMALANARWDTLARTATRKYALSVCMVRAARPRRRARVRQAGAARCAIRQIAPSHAPMVANARTAPASAHRRGKVYPAKSTSAQRTAAVRAAATRTLACAAVMLDSLVMPAIRHQGCAPRTAPATVSAQMARRVCLAAVRVSALANGLVARATT